MRRGKLEIWSEINAGTEVDMHLRAGLAYATTAKTFLAIRIVGQRVNACNRRKLHEYRGSSHPVDDHPIVREGIDARWLFSRT